MILAADPPIFYDGAADLIRVLVTVPILYFWVILCVRITGKRTTSQLNNFDWIFTVAIGSLIASPVLLDDVSILETLLAVALLIGLQWLVTLLSARSELAETVVKATPTLLVYKGQLREDAMDRERISREEIMSALRQNGLVSLDRALAVVLESDAGLSVIPRDTDHPQQTARALTHLADDLSPAHAVSRESPQSRSRSAPDSASRENSSSTSTPQDRSGR